MDRNDALAGQFEHHRVRLRRLAFRMLGSAHEADDAVQEAWLRLERQEADTLDNLGGWLTTVVARVSLDVLRTRKARRDGDDALEAMPTDDLDDGSPQERDAMLADSLGVALMVVLERLAPSERIAFVLADLFDVSFDEIAPIVGRSVAATRQLASRARRRVRGGASEPDGAIAARREIVDAFLAAAREGDLRTLLSLLDPDVVFETDAVGVGLGASASLRGADAVAGAFNGRAQAARTALLDGAVGISVAPRGPLMIALELTFHGGRIAAIDAMADPRRLRDIVVTAM